MCVSYWKLESENLNFFTFFAGCHVCFYDNYNMNWGSNMLCIEKHNKSVQNGRTNGATTLKASTYVGAASKEN